MPETITQIKACAEALDLSLPVEHPDIELDRRLGELAILITSARDKISEKWKENWAKRDEPATAIDLEELGL